MGSDDWKSNGCWQLKFKWVVTIGTQMGGDNRNSNGPTPQIFFVSLWIQFVQFRTILQRFLPGCQIANKIKKKSSPTLKARAADLNRSRKNSRISLELVVPLSPAGGRSGSDVWNEIFVVSCGLIGISLFNSFTHWYWNLSNSSTLIVFVYFILE